MNPPFPTGRVAVSLNFTGNYFAQIPEGPVWDNEENVLYFTRLAGEIYRFTPGDQSAALVAAVEGGPNATKLATDGSLIIANNGGWPTLAATPCLQRLRPDGRIDALTDRMNFPHDLVVGPDGGVYFTDMIANAALPPIPPQGRILVLRPDGTTEVLTEGLTWPSGIVFDRDGISLLVIESRPFEGPADKHDGVLKLEDFGRGAQSWFAAPELFDAMLDKFCTDLEGRHFLAGAQRGIFVLAPDGTPLGSLPIESDGPVLFHNCTFGGADGRTLFGCDSQGGGRIWAWEEMPAPGLALARAKLA